MDDAKAITVLNELIEVSKDGEEGFRACAQGARDSGLKIYFGTCADRCRESARLMAEEVLRRGGTPQMESSMTGAVHRAFMSVKTLFSRDDDLAILDECERGEDLALRAFIQALDEPLPADVRTLIQSQFLGVKHNHDRIKALRDERRRKSA